MFSCGGSVINNRYGITAAHCFCNDDTPCIEKNNTLTFPYDPEKNVFFLLGLNGIDVDFVSKKLLKKYNHAVESVIVYPGFKKASIPDHIDLALVKTQKKITFSQDISPICMPEVKGKKIT